MIKINKKIPLLRNKYNLFLVGMDRSPDDVDQSAWDYLKKTHVGVSVEAPRGVMLGRVKTQEEVANSHGSWSPSRRGDVTIRTWVNPRALSRASSVSLPDEHQPKSLVSSPCPNAYVIFVFLGFTSVAILTTLSSVWTSFVKFQSNLISYFY